MLNRDYLLRWGVGTPFAGETRFDGADGLLAALDLVTCESIMAGAPLRADLYTAPTVMDPLMIQFTVGDPADEMLVWHLDGEAVGCQVDPATLRQALIVYLMVGERAAALDWQLLPGD